MHLSGGKLRVPPLPLEGGCQCGAVRYRLSATPLVFYLCHCRNCQRHSSSAFGESLRIRSPDLHLEGETAEVTWQADSGNLRRGRFCPACGVRLLHLSRQEFVNIKAGTLDDPGWLIPAGHIWARSRRPFIELPEDGLIYQTEPEDGFARLSRRWKEMLPA